MLKEPKIDWDDPSINARRRFVVPKFEPAIDEEVSRIVCKKIYLNDPRLIKLVVKWKRGKSENSKAPDNFLKDPEKVEELKTALSKDF